MARDPYRNYKFEVEIGGFVRAGFSKIGGLERTTQVVDYREGGENEVMRKLPGQTEFSELTFERGVSNDDDFNAWLNQTYDPEAVDGQQIGGDIRRQVVIYLKDSLTGVRVKKWTVYRAWCNALSFGDLDASANDVFVETATIQNEGWKMESLDVA